MTDYKLQARIPKEIADRLFEEIKDLQEVTEGAEVTVSSMTRAAIDSFIKERSNKNIKIELDNTKISIKELESATHRILELANSIDSAGEKYIYKEIARKLLVEQCDR